MLVLGIETTCDETAVSVVRDGKEILSNIVYSQMDIHSKFGGVFPELSCRRHQEVLIPTIKEALKAAGVQNHQIDLISVARGPGLIGALLIGLNGAKALSLAWDKPYVGVNHVEAHLYASMMNQEAVEFPSLGVVVSGGHTFLVRILELGKYELLGTTQDDAIGEAFDKVGSMLGLSYPGGPAIEALAAKGDPLKFPFKKGRIKERPWDFSFSGLKTNVLYTVKGANALKNAPLKIKEEEIADICASFQETALGDVVEKAVAAAKTFACKGIYLGGGVSNNKRLRALFAEKEKTIPTFWPPFGLSLDNAAMIAGLGYHHFLRQGKGDSLDLEPMTRIPIN